MKRFLFVVGPWFPTNVSDDINTGGGLETYYSYLLKELVKRGHKVDLVAPDDSVIDPQYGINHIKFGDVSLITREGDSKRINWGLYHQVFSKMDFSQYDVLFLGIFHQALIKALCKFTTKKFIIYFNDVPLGAFLDNMLNAIKAHKDQIVPVTVSDFSTELWRKTTGIECKIIRLSLPDYGFDLNVPVDFNSITYVCRINPRKSVDEYTRFAALNPDLNFNYIGFSINMDKKVPVEFKEGEYVGSGLGYDEAVQNFMDAVPNMHYRRDLSGANSKVVNFMKTTPTVMAQWAKVEPGSVCAIEAMAAGLPLVTIMNRTSVLPEFIKLAPELYVDPEGRFEIHTNGLLVNRKGNKFEQAKSLNEGIKLLPKYINRKDIHDYFIKTYGMEVHLKQWFDLIETIKD